MLAARAQIELQTVAACAQVQGDGAVAIDSGVGVGDAFFGAVALIHDEGVDVQWQVAAGQGAEVDRCTIDVQAQQGAVDRVGQFAPLAAHGVEALAQGGAGGHGAQAKGELEEALKSLELEALVIARPSLLLDSRAHLGQPPRLAESVAIPMARLIAPLIPSAYRPIHGKDVARALLRSALTAKSAQVLTSGDMVGR